MVRIVGVTFETEAGAGHGRFAIPPAVARLLGIGDGDRVELSVQWEGQRIVAATELRGGLEVFPRAEDPSTDALEQIPPRAALTVTVWRENEIAEGVVPEPRAEPWTAARFDEDLARRRGTDVVRRARRIREWAQSQGLHLWWGRGRYWGGWVPIYETPSGRSYQFIEVWTAGNVEVQFSYLKAHASFADPAKRHELRRRLNEVAGISLPPDAVERRRSFQLGDLSDDVAIDRVLRVFDWVLEEMRSQ